ncbi:MAG: hypothetical protein CL748_05385 [Chloroflexi bacterium]|nr:hypothetical protein [Chloroflexota bacterium]
MVNHYSNNNIIVTESDQLRKLINSLCDEKFISFDTEFIRNKTYWPVLCSIQLHARENSILIDTLSNNINLDFIKKILSNKKITKIFHAHTQDLEILNNLFNIKISNIFDTQIAASFLGYDEQISYQKLVEKVLGIELDKKERISDWSRRPLSKKQIKYALNDVKFLYKLYEPLSNNLSKNNKIHWMKEEMEFCVNNTFGKFGKNTHNDEYSVLYKKIYNFREEIAKNMNLPRKWIFQDKLIRNLIISKNRKNLLREVDNNFVNKNQKTSLCNLIEIYLKDNKIHPRPKKNKLNTIQNKLLDSISYHLGKTAIMYNISKGLIANRKDIEQIVLNDNPENKILLGWRKEIFGNDALIAKKGVNL